MRLSQSDIVSIKEAARDTFGDDAIVRLFGSRTNDALEGGDVDLHVEVPAAPDVSQRRWAMLNRLWRTLRYEKIDLLVSQRGGRPRGFERIAYRDGVVL